MLPIGAALIGSLAHSGVIGSDILSAVECPPTSSALPDIESSGLFVYTGVSQPPARCSVLWPLLTSRGISSVGISPGKNALLPGTTAAFTSTTEPCDFAVLCQLVASLSAFYAVLVHRLAGFR